MPQLDVIHRRPDGPARPVPLLFVHGAFCNAAIWDVTFLPWFAERGWDCHAVSLRGHGASGGRDRLLWHSVDDYVQDALSVVDALPVTPALIGHSMGGMMVQRVLQRRPIPAAVLMASAPPHGLWQSTVGLAFRDPYVFGQMSVLVGFGAEHAHPEGLRRAMFSDRMPPEEAMRYEHLLQEESRRALVEMTAWTPFPPKPVPGIPVRVLGAEKDLLFPPDQVRATARHFGVEATFFPGMGHTMMLEPGWADVATTVHAWLAATLSVDR